MTQYIDKSALVAEIEKLIENGKLKYQQSKENNDYESYVAWSEHIATCGKILFVIDTLEVKEVGVAIPNIDDLFEEDSIDPNSKEAKIFKESYYMALEKLKEKKEK